MGCWHVWQLATWSRMPLCILSHQKHSSTFLFVACCPAWPPSGVLCIARKVLGRCSEGTTATAALQIFVRSIVICTEVPGV